MTSSVAYRCHAEDGQVRCGLEPVPTRPAHALTDGEVAVRVAWSSINYKDALAATGTGKIMRRFPLTAGIDLAGVVEASADPRWHAGDAVVVVGCGIGEEHDGGFAEQACVRGDWIVRLPPALTLREAMGLGTAGFTAALAIHRMEANGTRPSSGPIAVTGATGGVGSLAINMLAGRGYQVAAITGKTDAAGYLTALGAQEVVLASALTLKARPLETARWGGAIDNVGGEMLGWLCATTQPLGNIASVGLAASHVLATTVMPFILRGVSLLGINSTYCPPPLRDAVWDRLAGDLRPAALDAIVTREVALADLPSAFQGYTARQIMGRTVVRVSGALR